CQQDYDWPPTF
nr:immunoglobulin light chain junction region [Macaca mulatta]MOV79241.1 immunoglobulin light chain junction region [Macaca mulatta]MOV80314.1 immunoglobulin light chain junction region [Macaca mulatta]MOV80327.1 immunoglobulin light chain junction region [Macaca mulatta]MOV85093.1 immunoglobulin light chain junction region [Macaca mulatta]